MSLNLNSGGHYATIFPTRFPGGPSPAPAPIIIIPPPIPLPPTRFPTQFPSVSPTFIPRSSCQDYPEGPPIGEEAIQIPQANQLAANGNTSSVVVEGIVVSDFRNDSPNGFYIQGLTSHLPSAPSRNADSPSHSIFVDCDSILGCEEEIFNEGDFVRVFGDLDYSSNFSKLVIPDIALLNESTPSLTPNCPDLAFQVHILDFELPMKINETGVSLEGMLINMVDPLVVTDLFPLRFGQIEVTPERIINPTMLVEPGTEQLSELQDLQDRSAIILDDNKNAFCPAPQLYFDPQQPLRTGSELSLDATVTLTFDKNVDKFILTPTNFGKSFIPSTIVDSNPREGHLTEPAEDELRITSFNLFNYFTSFDCEDCRGADNEDEFTRQSLKLYSAIFELNSDILCAQELQNFGDEVLDKLVNDLNGFFREEDQYDYIDAGQVGNDVIKNGILFKPSKVTPTGNFSTLTFVDPVDKSRDALAQTFERVVNDSNQTDILESFTVVCNHFKSKGSPCEEDDSGIGKLAGEANCGLTRANHASQLIDWIDTNPTNASDLNFLLMGDFNSHKQERSIQRIESAGFVNLAFRDEPFSPHYTLSFGGKFATTDYIFASRRAANSCGGTKEWHINSDEANIIDYKDEQFSSPDECLIKPAGFIDLSPFRSSDHDPVFTQCLPIIALPTQAPTVAASSDGVGGVVAGVLAVIVLMAAAVGYFVWNTLFNGDEEGEENEEEVKEVNESKQNDGMDEVYKGDDDNAEETKGTEEVEVVEVEDNANDAEEGPTL